jgi:hypothetical protein
MFLSIDDKCNNFLLFSIVCLTDQLSINLYYIIYGSSEDVVLHFSEYIGKIIMEKM